MNIILTSTASNLVKRLLQGPRAKHNSLGLACFALMLSATPTKAAFHLWQLQELYSNSTGSLQFIELFAANGSQQFVGGQQISVSNIGNTLTNTFTIPTNLPSDSTNKSFLLGTAGLQAAGGPTPDYIIPNNFLFTGGGSVSFFGTNSGTYTALPTNGTASRIWGGGDNASNSPRNFAGQMGTVVPEPTSLCLAALSIVGVCCMSRRRKA
jgi:PEP-CTERM motif